MSWFSNKSNFVWQNLNNNSSIQQIILDSDKVPQIIFKHSTRCSISSMALNRFEREWDPEVKAQLHYLDLIAFRSLSNEIAEKLNVEHQSPQVILLINGSVYYTASHNGISANEILKQIINS
jgi:bacillithiol system protein YtxJ